jgi:ATP-dependent RNA helicase DeaD
MTDPENVPDRPANIGDPLAERPGAGAENTDRTDAEPGVEPEPAAEAGDRPTTFADLGIRPEVLKALSGLGYEEPTPIQREAIGPILAGRDLLGQAATGTGKTAAFALPILERVHPGVGGGVVEPVALVLVPTRELAIQVSEAIYRYGKDLGASVLPIYGGQPIVRQLKVLHRGVHVVVATPGRAIDHINRGTLPLDAVELVVLDEADEMLDMGFAEDLEAILQATPPERQTVLFSATMPGRLNGIVNRHLRNPVRVEIGRAGSEPGNAPLVRQVAYLVARSNKAAALGRILDVESPTAAIVFCRTRNEVDELTETLNARGYRCEALHGGMDQEQRDRVMGRLRSGTAELLVATDVAARGLDVDQLTHVVNYDVPSAPDSYVHRIGRVGRAGREGTAITLAEPRERRMLTNIERATRQSIAFEKVPTVADLRARQMELTVDQVREALQSEDLDRFRVVVDALADEFDVADIALAAVKLIHEASGATDDDEEIPDIPVRAERDRPAKGGGRQGGYQGGPKSGGYQGGKGGSPRPEQGDRPSGGPKHRGPQGDVSRLYVGVGRNDRVRPQDLVGAIAGETRLNGSDIGAIRIFDRFALVEVPTDAVGHVIEATKATTIRGKRANIRRDRDE